MKQWITLALGASLLIGCDKEKTSNGHDLGNKGEAISVTTIAVKKQVFEDWQEFTADLRGSKDVMLVTRVGGKLDQLAKVGQRVAAGQSLCSIENSRFQAMVSQAQAALDLAKSEDVRMKANVDAGSLGKDVLLKSKLDVENAKVALINAQTNLRDNQCPAPFGGVVVSRQVEDFQFVSPGVPVLRLAQDDRFEAVVAIPEMQSRFLKPGQSAQFSLATDANIKVDAKLKNIDLASDARTRTYKARLEIPNRSGLKIGMVGRVRILINSYADAILVPSSALLRMQTGIFAMVVGKDGKAEQRKLEIAETSGEQVRVVSGLNEGDKLIASGAFRLTPGTNLKVEERKQ